MKKDQVRIGETYRVKVSGSMADVKITAENPHGGWDGVNVLTNRKVHIKSAQRLRGKTPTRPGGKRKKTCPPPAGRRVMSLAEYEAGATTSAKATKEPKAARKRRTGERDAKGAKRMSGLDAATQVLADAGEPLNTKTMVERMLSQGLWNTSGKTPAATIYAAIIREIAAKGSDARFRKVERGKFAHTGVRRDELAK